MGMGTELREVVAVAKRLLSRLDPSTLSSHDAASMLEVAATLQNIGAGFCALLAPRAADSGQWRRDGARSEAEWIGRKLGGSDGDGRAALDTGRALETLPVTDDALRSGKLSAQQAAAVASGAAVDSNAEERLLQLAERDSLAGLRKERDRVKAAADPDPEARYRRLHRNRYLRTWTDADGAGRGTWSLPPDKHASVLAALQPRQDAAFTAARVAGERESAEAYAADALVALADASTGGGEPSSRSAPPPKAIVRIDHDALMRGTTEPGETCEIAGVGPVPVSLVREWMDVGDLFLTAIVTKGVDVCTVAHLGRKPTAFQTTALQWRDVVCRIECCKRPAVEWDHHEDWADTLETRLWDLGGMCSHHHDLKTNKGYRLKPSPLPGKLRLLPPADP